MHRANTRNGGLELQTGSYSGSGLGDAIDWRALSAFSFYLENDMSSEDSRYPYTYACDFIRSIAGYGEGGTKLSRSDASQIRSKIAQIIGMPDEELARKIADHYLADQEAIERKQAEEFLSSIGISPFGVA